MKMVRARVPSLLKKGGRAFTDREHFQDMKIEITIQTDKNKNTKKTLAFTDREHLQYMRTKQKIANNKSQKTKQISKKHKTRQNKTSLSAVAQLRVHTNTQKQQAKNKHATDQNTKRQNETKQNKTNKPANQIQKRKTHR